MNARPIATAMNTASRVVVASFRVATALLRALATSAWSTRTLVRSVSKSALPVVMSVLPVTGFPVLATWLIVGCA